MLSLGGSLVTYGLGNLKKSECLEDFLPFLHCVSAENKEPVLFSSIEIAQGVYADIHLISNESGIWVLFLDTTAETEQLRLMRQKLNETILQLEEANRKIGQLQKEIDSFK